MDLYGNRLATFKSKNLDGSKKKVWPAKFKNNRPFTAEYLAKIGFIHTPTKSRADCLTCSVCNTECNWSESHEHPLSFHLDHNPCWNSRIWGAGAVSRQIIDDRSLEMSLAEFKELLMKSFTESKTKWVFPLKSKKHPNEQDLVDAGLCFVPSTEDLDTTICPYCELEIVGWEKGDDAWYLGLNRKEHEMQAEGCCPFFDLSTDEKPLSKQNQIKMVLGVIESSESEMNKSEMTEQSEFEEDLVVAPVIQKQLTYKSAKRAKNLQLNKVSASETRRETPKPEPKMKGKRTAARKTKDINAEEESRQAVRKKGITKMENQKKNEIGAEIQAASLESTKFTDGHKKSSKNPPLNRAKIDSDEHELVLARKTRQRGVTEPKTVTVNEISDKNVAPPKRPSRSKAIKIGKSVTATESNSSMEATACKEGITITNPGEDKHDRTRSTSRATVIDSSKSNSDGSAKIDDQPMPPISKEIKVKKVVRRAARVDAKEAGAISELGMEKIERKKPDVLNHDVQNINTDDLTDFSIPVKTQCKNNIDTEQVSAIGAKATMDLQSTEVLAADSHGSEVKNTDSSAETLNTSEKYSKLGSQSTWAARDFPRILSEKPSSQIENHSSNATIREVKTTLTLVAPVGQEISGMQPITSTASNVSGNSVQKDNYTSCKFTPSIHAEEPVATESPLKKVDVVKVTTNPSGAVKASFPGMNPILTASRAQPCPLKSVSTENKRKREEEVSSIKSKKIEIEPSTTHSSSIAETTTKVDTAVEILAASSALPIQDIYKLYHENYNLSVRSFLELLSDKTAEKMDKAFIQELKKIES